MSEENKTEWKAYGDVSPLEYGGAWVKKDREHNFYVIKIDILGNTDNIRFSDTYIDTTDTWINKKAVKDFVGADDQKDYSEEMYALDIVSYYGEYHCGGEHQTYTDKKELIERLKGLGIEVNENAR